MQHYLLQFWNITCGSRCDIPSRGKKELKRTHINDIFTKNYVPTKLITLTPSAAVNGTSLNLANMSTCSAAVSATEQN